MDKLRFTGSHFQRMMAVTNTMIAMLSGIAETAQEMMILGTIVKVDVQVERDKQHIKCHEQGSKLKQLSFHDAKLLFFRSVMLYFFIFADGNHLNYNTSMKKLTIIAVAMIGCFLMASCNKSPKEAIMKATDEFFAQAEKDVNAITNGEDFMAFFNNFEQKKEDFLYGLLNKYPSDDDANFTQLSAEENDALYEYMYERATAYNKVESAKCSEFLTPIVDRFEKAVNALYDKFLAGDDVDDSLINDIEAAYNDLEPYAEYDNVPEELANRFQAAQSLIDEMFGDDEEE